LPQFRQRFDFICPAYGDICSLLDAAKVADCLLLTMSASTRDVNSYADHCLSCLLAQGLPACVFGIQVASVIYYCQCVTCFDLATAHFTFILLADRKGFQSAETSASKPLGWP